MRRLATGNEDPDIPYLLLLPVAMHRCISSQAFDRVVPDNDPTARQIEPKSGPSFGTECLLPPGVSRVTYMKTHPDHYQFQLKWMAASMGGWWMVDISDVQYLAPFLSYLRVDCS